MRVGTKIKYKYEDYHKDIDGILYKKCVSHEIYFPDEDCWIPCTSEYFYSNKKNSKDGLYPECKKCSVQRSYSWRKDNRDIWLESQRKSNLNPERKQEIRERKREHRENGYQLNWQRNNPEKMIEYAQNKKLHRTHNVTKNEWNACLKYFNHRCAYCGLPLEKHYNMYMGNLRWENLHKEHAIHNGGNDLTNCIPSCKSCNDQKWEYDFDEWFSINNINFTQEKYDKIVQWLMEDCFQYIEEKKPKGKYVKDMTNPKWNKGKMIL